MSSPIEEVFICFGTEEFLDINSDFFEDNDDDQINAIVEKRHQ